MGQCELKRSATHSVDLPWEAVDHLAGNQNPGQVGKEMLVVSSGQRLSKYSL